MSLFVKGRELTFKQITAKIAATDQTLWFHCASLGEFEQGLPIIEALKNEFPKFKVVISFFSPSGYEIKKDSHVADLVIYLPLDTPSNAKKFIKNVHPTMAFFVKYEFWPNYLFELKKNNIPAILIAGLFRENQVFFKSYGNFMRRALRSFHHIFVQNKLSETLLHQIDLTNVSISGDTRFDRVSNQIEQNNTLDFMEVFKNDHLCIVCGSTWPEDDAVLLPYINSTQDNIKFVVAPHKIDSKNINDFQKQLKKPSLRYSEINTTYEAIQSSKVLVIDTIGLLTKIYSYADIAYVGGAMGNTGLHNILEAATFGVSIVIGKHFNEFPEAQRLQSLAGLFSVANETDVHQILQKLTTDASFRTKTGMIAGHFVNSNTGATAITLAYIKKELNKLS